MLCERCKIREANIQYTEVINGVKTDHHFCTQCAKEMDFGQYSAIFEGEFPFAQLLSALLGGESPTQKADKYQQIVCPTCGMTYQEFVDNSCFGCADCYQVFDVLIHDNIKQIQGSDCHRGKRPAYQNISSPEEEEISDAEGTDGRSVSGTGTLRPDASGEYAGPGLSGEEAETAVRLKIRSLERKLKAALRLEKYEDAAQLRDEIHALKEGMKTDA